MHRYIATHNVKCLLLYTWRILIAGTAFVLGLNCIWLVRRASLCYTKNSSYLAVTENYGELNNDSKDYLIEKQSNAVLLRPEFQREYFVALSVIRDPQQLFQVAGTILVWQNLGVHSLIYLMGEAVEYERHRQTQHIVDFLHDIGARTSFIPSDAAISNIKLARMAQLLAAGTPKAYNLERNAMIIVSDFDVLPTNLDHYVLWNLDANEMDRDILWNNHDCIEYDSGSPCRYSVTMSVRNWRKFIGVMRYEIKDGGSVVSYLNKRMGNAWINASDIGHFVMRRRLKDTASIGFVIQHPNKSAKRTRLEWKQGATIPNITFPPISGQYEELILTECLDSDANWRAAKDALTKILNQHVFGLLEELREEVRRLGDPVMDHSSDYRL